MQALGRVELDTGWRWLATQAGQHEAPAGLPADGWTPVDRLGTAAHCLRSAGRWTLDDAPPVPLDTQDWWFRTDWCVDAPHAADALNFGGLATLAQVWLNGQPVLDSRSMFLSHEVVVGPWLRPGANELVVVCRALEPELARRRPRPAWRVPMLAQQQLRWVRTSLLGRTPGWSPPVPAVGPWRAVSWLPGDRLRAEDLRLHVHTDGRRGQVSVALRIPSPRPVTHVQLRLRRGDHVHTVPAHDDGSGQWQAMLALDQVDLWWPHTHGEPALYELEVHAGHAAQALQNVLTRRIGFRQLSVDQADGAFQLRVNGVPVFCRGACWTPLDPVSLQAEPQALQAAVAQVARAGMNMLRVAGTMVYEQDAFHDACDAQGVLVWQDLMFANMDYPAQDADFAASAAAEVAQQAARWQGRPSLAVVCGNSEVSQQAAMWGAPRSAWAPALFHEQMPALLAHWLPEVPYWPSSAWGGAFPHQVSAGTTSYYGVGAYELDMNDARRSGLRFATECLALANVPSSATLARLPGPAPVRPTHAIWQARASHDLGAGWDFHDVRDHYMALLCGVDPARLRYQDHERYLHLARATSAELMARTFAQWRAQGSRCGGALVWFLRDLWAGAGWGLLDDQGGAKACFHALRRVLQPRAVMLTDEGNNGLLAHVVNEGAEPWAVRLSLRVWRGEAVLAQGQQDLALAARSTQAVPLLALLDRFLDLNQAYRFGPLAHDCVELRLLQGDEVVGRALHLPRDLAVAPDPLLELRAQSSVQADGTVVVQVGSARLALGVHFEAPGYEPDDEYFHLAPGQVHAVRFRPVGKGGAWFCTVSALNALAPANVRPAA